MGSHGELAGCGAAERRRERPSPSVASPRALTVQMALCEALHHAVLQVERGENSAPRGQKTHKAGGRSGALKEPEPPVGVVRAPSPRTAVPSLATPSLVDATADVVDASSLRLLTTRALSEQYEEQLQERAAFHGADRSEAGC